MPRNGSCTIPRRIPSSFRGAICFTPWPLVPDTEICFLFRVPAVFLSARAFWHFNTAILAKMIFYHKLCRHPTNRKTKDKDEKEAKLHLPFSLKFCSQGTELNCSARPHCPPWVIGCGFPHPKKRKMKKERKRNSQTKGMENGSFRYTLILSYLFVFVSNNFLRRWFIPNMNLSSMISYSCTLSAFLTAFLARRNRVFVAAGTDAVLMSFRLLFVFPPLLWCVFRHLHHPLFLSVFVVPG